MTLKHVERRRIVREHIILEVEPGDDAANEAEKLPDGDWTIDEEIVSECLVSDIDGQ